MQASLWLLLLLLFHCFQVSFEQESFSVVIDRGELDALHENVSTGKRTDIDVTEYLNAVQRLLKVGGRFLCFTFATVEILNYLLDYFSSGWFFRVHLLTTQLSVCLPMFGFVLTKTKFSGELIFSITFLSKKMLTFTLLALRNLYSLLM